MRLNTLHTTFHAFLKKSEVILQPGETVADVQPIHIHFGRQCYAELIDSFYGNLVLAHNAHVSTLN